MGWAKFDDQFTDHPKIVAAGPLAELLAIRAVIYCARYETDGFIQFQQISKLSLGISSKKHQIAALVNAGIWEETDGGWLKHDFLDYHPSAQQKHEERAERGLKKAYFPDYVLSQMTLDEELTLIKKEASLKPRKTIIAQDDGNLFKENKSKKTAKQISQLLKK